jgi:hypothetical protein
LRPRPHCIAPRATAAPRQERALRRRRTERTRNRGRDAHQLLRPFDRRGVRPRAGRGARAAIGRTAAELEIRRHRRQRAAELGANRRFRGRPTGEFKEVCRLARFTGEDVDDLRSHRIALRVGAVRWRRQHARRSRRRRGALRGRRRHVPEEHIRYGENGGERHGERAARRAIARQRKDSRGVVLRDARRGAESASRCVQPRLLLVHARAAPRVAVGARAKEPPHPRLLRHARGVGIVNRARRRQHLGEGVLNEGHEETRC